MMKKIKDERLIMKNLQNIRIAYIIQTIGILGILGYYLVTKGMDGMTDNPIWYVFIVTAIVSTYLSMNVNVDHENRKKDPKKRLYLSILIITVLSFLIGLLVINTDGYKLMNGVLIGGIIFVCCLTPVLYTYYLRNKRERDIDEEE